MRVCEFGPDASKLESYLLQNQNLTLKIFMYLEPNLIIAKEEP